MANVLIHVIFQVISIMVNVTYVMLLVRVVMETSVVIVLNVNQVFSIRQIIVQINVPMGRLCSQLIRVVDVQNNVRLALGYQPIVLLVILQINFYIIIGASDNALIIPILSPKLAMIVIRVVSTAHTVNVTSVYRDTMYMRLNVILTVVQSDMAILNTKENVLNVLKDAVCVMVKIVCVLSV
jgi:hypothetical protein